MSAVAAMVKPPPPRPSSSSRSSQPPPPPPQLKRKAESLQPSSSKLAPRPKIDTGISNISMKIMEPVTLRDVNIFEKKDKLGQGTYGSVFKGKDKVNGEIVALKRINTEQEENGFPITAIREVKILKALSHQNIVKLKEIVTSKEKGQIPKNVYMVFEYLEYDLTGILETPEIRFSQDHIKSWSQQLLSGVHYMHTNKIIHRDLKASNLLINKKGELKIADWGLARSWNNEMKRLTNRVITLWYRPPELLLGAVEYGPKIDMWSVGCIIAEMFRRSGFLKGANELMQLDLIFKVAGHPTKESWPNIHKKCPSWKNYEKQALEHPMPRRLREVLRDRLPHPSWMTDKAKDLIDNLMILNPDKRWSAFQALDADYFFEDPIVKPASKLNMRFNVGSVHEWEARKKHELQHKNGSQQRPAPPSGVPKARVTNSRRVVSK